MGLFRYDGKSIFSVGKNGPWQGQNRTDLPKDSKGQTESNLSCRVAPIRCEQGFLFEGGHIFLLVTLDKSGMPQEHRYGDRFLSRDLFEWKSQNRHTQASSAGETMQNHEERGAPVHLLVRKTGKIGQKAAPFIYCGQLEFQRWEGARPITVWWRLRDA